MPRDPNPVPVQKVAFWAKRTYLAVTAVLVVFETVAIVNDESGDTISENIRSLFAADTKKGAIAWYAVWIPFSIWFGPHIAKIAQQKAQGIT